MGGICHKVSLAMQSAMITFNQCHGMKGFGWSMYMLTLGLFAGASIDLNAQRVPESYVAYRTVGPIEIDGKDDEASWRQASYTDPFIDIEGAKTPKYKTQAKMLWDDDYFYVLAKLEEPHVWGNLKQRDTVIFYNNDFEVFIDPNGDTHNYYELELNALNTVWDLFLTKPYRNGATVLDSWDVQGLKSAISIKGTLNNSTDTDDFWMVELAIPWAVLVEASGVTDPPENRFWRINFSRVNWDFDLNNGRYSRKKDANGMYLPEYNWVWSPQQVINMHEPERWGYVFFASQQVGADIGFAIPKDEHVKWAMYEVYRNILAKPNAPMTDAITVMDKNVPLYRDEHETGWNIWVTSPFSGKKMVIDHEGKYYGE